MVHVDETGKSTFTFRHGATGPVYVVGDFCRWQTDHLPMRQASEHEWVLMLRLPPGSYQFRYLADGRWFTDYAAFGVSANGLGDLNSVLRIPRVRPAVASSERTRRSIRARLAAAARIRGVKSA